MRQTESGPEPSRQSGVIESIADGLSLALARPLLLFLPMVLDLYFWAGWQVWLQSLTSPVRNWVLRQDQSESADIAASLESLGHSDATQLIALLTPSLLAGANRSEIYALGSRSVLSPDRSGVAMLTLVGFALLSTLLVMIYTVPLADAAVDRSRSLGATVGAIGRGWLRSLGLHILMIGIALILIGPVLIGAAVLLVVGVNVQIFVGLAVVAIGFGGLLIWWFAMKAIVVSETGPLLALYYGFAVVRRYFWQCLGFTAAWLVITIGLGQVWLKIADSAPGLLIAVIANAFFAGGLAMAGMMFYEGRIRTLAPVLSR